MPVNPISHIATEGMELKIQALQHMTSCYGGGGGGGITVTNQVC